MKLRPRIPLYAEGLRPSPIRGHLVCHQSRRFRAIAPCRRSNFAQVASIGAGSSGDLMRGCFSPLARYASSSTTASASAKWPHGRKREPPAPTRTTASHAPKTKVAESLNPPSVTYAPDLSVPPRERNQSFFKYVWRAGRAYLSFYKAGVSNVRQTSKLARSLREKASQAGVTDISKVLTRAEWQIVRRSRKDMLRLPAFGLIFLVFGEWTPLLVMYITPLIPEACRIPSQVRRQVSKLENRRHDRLRRVELDAPRFQSHNHPAVGSMAHGNTSPSSFLGTARDLQIANPLKLTRFELLLASARFGCHSRIFDVLHMAPPTFWLQRNVRNHFSYLTKDDALIQRDGGFQALEKRELERACIDRGIDVLNKGEGELRKALSLWFSAGKA